MSESDGDNSDTPSWWMRCPTLNDDILMRVFDNIDDTNITCPSGVKLWGDAQTLLALSYVSEQFYRVSCAYRYRSLALGGKLRDDDSGKPRVAGFDVLHSLLSTFLDNPDLARHVRSLDLGSQHAWVQLAQGGFALRSGADPPPYAAPRGPMITLYRSLRDRLSKADAQNQLHIHYHQVLFPTVMRRLRTVLLSMTALVHLSLDFIQVCSNIREGLGDVLHNMQLGSLRSVSGTLSSGPLLMDLEALRGLKDVNLTRTPSDLVIGRERAEGVIFEGRPVELGDPTSPSQVGQIVRTTVWMPHVRRLQLPPHAWGTISFPSVEVLSLSLSPDWKDVSEQIPTGDFPRLKAVLADSTLHLQPLRAILAAGRPPLLSLHLSEFQVEAMDILGPRLSHLRALACSINSERKITARFFEVFHPQRGTWANNLVVLDVHWNGGAIALTSLYGSELVPSARGTMQHLVDGLSNFSLQFLRVLAVGTTFTLDGRQGEVLAATKTLSGSLRRLQTAHPKLDRVQWTNPDFPAIVWTRGTNEGAGAGTWMERDSYPLLTDDPLDVLGDC